MSAAQEQETVARLRDMVAQILEITTTEVAAEARFYEDLEMDSLQKTELIVRVEQEFGVVLTPEDATAAMTVAETVKMITGGR